MAAKKLTEQQAEFARQYVLTGDAEEAARLAGYKDPAKGRQLVMRKGRYLHVRREIDRLQFRHAARLEVTTQKVLQELAAVGFSNPRQLFDEQGRMKAVSEWDDYMAAAVASVEVFEEFEGVGRARHLVGYTKKIRLWDKVAALEKLGKHLNLFVDKHEHLHVSLSNDELVGRIRELVERARTRRLAALPVGGGAIGPEVVGDGNLPAGDAVVDALPRPADGGNGKPRR